MFSLEAIAISLEAIATRVEAIAIRFLLLLGGKAKTEQSGATNVLGRCFAWQNSRVTRRSLTELLLRQHGYKNETVSKNNLNMLVLKLRVFGELPQLQPKCLHVQAKDF